MSKKFAFIGAGSEVFTRNLSRDILTFPAFEDATIALMDINPDNLALAKTALDKIVEVGGYHANIIATTDRAEALDGADGVLSTIGVGDFDTISQDILIPREYGVNYAVGDTRGPAGIFRFLRTAPDLIDIVKDIEKYCPNAVFLNYTNPMAMLCRALQEVAPNVTTSGLCHSVQGTAAMLAGWIGAPMDEIDYVCAGINHQAFYTKFLWNGKDAYPLLREKMKDPEIFKQEKVRNEMFLNLDYYVTESSNHNSEYNWWFRKRPELIQQFCAEDDGSMFDMVELLRNHDQHRLDEFNKWINGEIKLDRGNEFAAYIFNAVFGDNTVFRFNGNVRNFGLVDNLPEGCCVEVPVYASKGGLEPVHVGKLPDHLAVLVNANAQCEELAVRGCLEGDPRKIFHACLNDPFTASVCSMKEIEEMVGKMFKAQEKWLPQFKHFN